MKRKSYKKFLICAAAVIMCSLPAAADSSLFEDSETDVFTEAEEENSDDETEVFAEEKEALCGKLKLSRDSLDFGMQYLYEQTPPSQTITLENAGTAPITLEHDEQEQLVFTPFTRITLWPGETASITLHPKAGLSPGSYFGTTQFRAVSNGEVVDAKNLYTGFSINRYYFSKWDALADPIILNHGAEKTQEGLHLPETIAVTYGEGENAYLTREPVAWNLESCTYQPQSPYAQSFQVEGTLQIPEEKNTKNLSTRVTAKIQVMAYAPMAKPKIAKAEVKGNQLQVSLANRVDDAQEYEYVLVKKQEDLETNHWQYHAADPGITIQIPYIEKGEYLLFARACQKVAESQRTDPVNMAYGPWSDGVFVSVDVHTPAAPFVTKSEVRKCDVQLTIQSKEKVDGFEAVLARRVTEGIPEDYLKSRMGIKGNEKTVLFQEVEKGTCYAVIRSYLIQNGKKIYSPWSEPRKTTVTKKKVSAAPSIKSTKLSKRNLTVKAGLPKETDGADWVLAEDYYTYKNTRGQVCYQPIDYVYVLKNKPGSTITFKSLKPGTYYLSGHAYVKGFRKSLSDWSKVKKIVVK